MCLISFTNPSPGNQACTATRIGAGCSQVNIDVGCGLEFREVTMWKLSAVALFWNHTSRPCFIPRVSSEGVDTLREGSILVCMMGCLQMQRLNNGLANTLNKSQAF